MDGKPIELEYSPQGKTGTVTARLNGDVLAVDNGDMRKAPFRKRFTAQLTKDHPGIDSGVIEAELLRIAGSVAKDKPTPTIAGDELDIRSIARPELFHTEAVSGLCVPCVRSSPNGPRGEWSLFLRWHADGRRERPGLCESLDLPEGGRLWLWPKPGEPLPTQQPGWSGSARRSWLEGAPAPSGRDVFERACKLFAQYLDFAEEDAPGATATLALWVLVSYAFTAWDVVPYLSIGGPIGSGKTTLFHVLARLCFHPLESSNMTAPAMFRTLHETGGVLLLDEAERLRDGTPEAGELRSILLSGYKRGSPAIRLEKTGDNFQRKEFDVFGLKAIAAVSSLSEALASRCIRLVMFRADAGSEKPRRRMREKADEFASLRDDLHALSLEHGRTWLRLASDPGLCPATLSGRDFELWHPLFALASWVEEQGVVGLRDILTEFSANITEAAREDSVPNCEELLVQIVAEHVRMGSQGSLKAGDVLDAARTRDPVAFTRWSPKGVGNALRRYRLRTTKGRGPRGLTYAKITEADMRRIERAYGFDLGFDSAHVPTSTERTDISA